VTGGLTLICIMIFSCWFEFLDFCNSMNDVSFLLVCDVASLDVWFLKFGEDVMVLP